MRMWTYVILMFAMTAVMYMSGETSVMAQMYAQQGNGTLSATDKTPSGWDAVSVLSPETWKGSLGVFNTIMIFFTILVSAGLLMTSLGFGSFFIFPAFALFAVFNFIIFPFSGILSPSSTMPDIVRIPIIVLFNILLVMSILSFIRGGD